MLILENLPSSPTTSQTEAIQRGRDIKAWRRGAQALGVSPDAKAPYRPISSNVADIERLLPARIGVRRSVALDGYTLRNTDEVRAFLDEHPVLLPLLEAAPHEIHQFFAGAPLSLEVVHDPEEDWAELVLRIGVPMGMTGREGFETLKKLDKAWWLHRSREARSAMEITLEWI